jgi:Raf kinase inhibitor-like YbhB/YbcL family protein
MILALVSNTATASSLAVWSEGFPSGGPIPSVYTCEGADVSPPLAWSAPADGARPASYVLVVDDPDAPGGTFVHWTAWNVHVNVLQVGATYGMVQGRNDFGRIGYGGPCPPRGHGVHHYRFRVYALDVTLTLPAGSDPDALARAMVGHVRAEGTLVGTYRRD